MLRKIADMNNEDQMKAFETLEKELGKEITDMLRERVFYIKLFTDNRFYNEVVAVMGAKLYEELA